MKFQILSYVSVFIVLFSSCHLIQDKKEAHRVSIAAVGNEMLYLEDIQSLFPPGIAAEDSLELLESYKTNWIRKTLLLNKAKADFQNDQELNSLVENYKESLILDFYKKNLIKTKLDSTITPEQYEDAYKKYKNNFLTEEAFYNLKVIMISRRNPQYKKFKIFWNEGKISSENMDSICLVGTTQCWLDDDLWLNYESLQKLTDTENIVKNKLKQGAKISFPTEDNEVYIYIRNQVPKGEISPLPIIKDDLQKYILNNRKEDLLKDASDALYKKALQDNSIKFNL